MSRILIVEDDANLSFLYATEFEEEGHDVETVASGAAALDAIERRAPDLLILDIKMEPMDGLEALGRIRERHHHLPVIINTAYPAFKADFATWGADAYLIKSGDLSELKATVRRLLAVPPGGRRP
jgi:DNA-binding response OmpR family regulator